MFSFKDLIFPKKKQKPVVFIKDDSHIIALPNIHPVNRPAQNDNVPGDKKC